MTAAIDAGLARAAADQLGARRARDMLFGADSDGFGEPGWDMMLALAASDHAIDRDELLKLSTCRPNVVARYLEWILSRGLADPANGRIALSARGRDLMAACLSSKGGLA